MNELLITGQWNLRGNVSGLARCSLKKVNNTELFGLETDLTLVNFNWFFQ